MTTACKEVAMACVTTVSGEIEMRFLRAEVGPNETAGVLAARSIDGPATRMMLDAFRHTGASAKNATTWVPRQRRQRGPERVPAPGPNGHPTSGGQLG